MSQRRSGGNRRSRRKGTGNSSIYGTSSRKRDPYRSAISSTKGRIFPGKSYSSKPHLKYKMGMYDYATKCPVCGEENYSEKLLYDHVMACKGCRDIMHPSNKSSPKYSDTKEKLKSYTITAYPSVSSSSSSTLKRRLENVIIPSTSFSDQKFTNHCRYNANNEFTTLDDIFMVTSAQDQFTHGGGSACTTIALEASLHMLYENVEVDNPYSWNEEMINKIVKDGCMMDPQQENLSFLEVMKTNRRFEDRVKILCQFGVKNVREAFRNAIKRVVSTAEMHKCNVSTIITKPPETICLFFKHHYSIHDTSKKKKYAKFFVVFDSHPRRTDFKGHGSHIIYFKKQDLLRKYLSKWVFAFVENSAQLNNTYTFTVLTTKEDTFYEPFVIPDISIDEETDVLPNINSKIGCERDQSGSASSTESSLKRPSDFYKNPFSRSLPSPHKLLTTKPSVNRVLSFIDDSEKNCSDRSEISKGPESISSSQYGVLRKRKDRMNKQNSFLNQHEPDLERRGRCDELVEMDQQRKRTNVKTRNLQLSKLRNQIEKESRKLENLKEETNSATDNLKEKNSELTKVQNLVEEGKGNLENVKRLLRDEERIGKELVKRIGERIRSELLQKNRKMEKKNERFHRFKIQTFNMSLKRYKISENLKSFEERRKRIAEISELASTKKRIEKSISDLRLDLAKEKEKSEEANRNIENEHLAMKYKLSEDLKIFKKSEKENFAKVQNAYREKKKREEELFNGKKKELEENFVEVQNGYREKKKKEEETFNREKEEFEGKRMKLNMGLFMLKKQLEEEKNQVQREFDSRIALMEKSNKNEILKLEEDQDAEKKDIMKEFEEFRQLSGSRLKSLKSEFETNERQGRSRIKKLKKEIEERETNLEESHQAEIEKMTQLHEAKKKKRDKANEEEEKKMKGELLQEEEKLKGKIEAMNQKLREEKKKLYDDYEKRHTQLKYNLSCLEADISEKGMEKEEIEKNVKLLKEGEECKEYELLQRNMRRVKEEIDQATKELEKIRSTEKTCYLVVKTTMNEIASLREEKSKKEDEIQGLDDVIGRKNHELQKTCSFIEKKERERAVIQVNERFLTLLRNSGHEFSGECSFNKENEGKLFGVYRVMKNVRKSGLKKILSKKKMKKKVVLEYHFLPRRRIVTASSSFKGGKHKKKSEFDDLIKQLDGVRKGLFIPPNVVGWIDDDEGEEKTTCMNNKNMEKKKKKQKKKTWNKQSSEEIGLICGKEEEEEDEGEIE